MAWPTPPPKPWPPPMPLMPPAMPPITEPSPPRPLKPTTEADKPSVGISPAPSTPKTIIATANERNQTKTSSRIASTIRLRAMASVCARARMIVAPCQIAGSDSSMHRNRPSTVMPATTTETGNTTVNRSGPRNGILQTTSSSAITMKTASSTRNSRMPSAISLGMHIRP